MALVLTPHRLRPLRTSSRETLLDFYPSALSMLEVIVMILIFVARQVLHMIGIANNFKVAEDLSGRKAYTVPELQLSMPFRITREELQAYVTAVGSGNIESVVDDRVQLCFLLSALTEPAMLLLLGHHLSPIRPLGGVNVRNTFELLDPGLCGVEKLLNMGKAEVRAVLLPNARAVKRGLEMDIEASVIVHSGGQARVAFRQVFTMLQFMKTQAWQKTEVDDSAPIKNAIENKSVNFAMDAASTLRWARTCKDYNPIHTSRIAAKLFGFPGIIAHGNHVAARALARLQQDGQELQSNVSTFVKVQFKRPIPLEATISAQVIIGTGGECQVRISQGTKLCIATSIK